jgi:alkylhydroperoxidase family enzyme
MAHVAQVSENEAEGLLRRIYDAGGARAGSVARIITLMSRDARSLQGSMQFYVSLMKSPNALEPARREMLAAVVSNVNDCYY